jgi:transposase
MPGEAALLMEDETILRLFPVLRRAWALRGQQAVVPITGRNAKRVLFGALNLRTGRRICLRRLAMRQANFQDLLRLARHRYRGRPIWMLLDEAPCHIAARSQALAERLDIHLVWLPKQCPELNAMDQLWKELKSTISANHQFPTIDQHADYAEDWLLHLTNLKALRKAGVLSKKFWLGSFI